MQTNNINEANGDNFISSKLWVYDDPFVCGKLIGHITDPIRQLSHPLILNDHKITVCEKPDRRTAAVELEMPGEVVGLTGCVIEIANEQRNVDIESGVDSELEFSSEIIFVKSNIDIVTESVDEFLGFAAFCCKTDEGNIIEVVRFSGDALKSALDTVEFGAEIEAGDETVVQIVDMGDELEPILVTVSGDGKELKFYNIISGRLLFTHKLETRVLFSLQQSPGYRLIGYDGKRVVFFDVFEDRIEQAGSIDNLDGDLEKSFFDSVSLPSADNPLLGFYNGNALHYINLFEMNIINSIQDVPLLKPGFDSVFFPGESGLFFIENEIASSDELSVRLVKVSENSMTPFFRSQFGRYDGGLFGFKGDDNKIRIFLAYPDAMPEITEYSFDGVEGEVESMVFSNLGSQKLLIFTDKEILETEPIRRWKNINKTELQGFKSL